MRNPPPSNDSQPQWPDKIHPVPINSGFYYNVLMKVIDLGTLPYREAWALQEQHHDAVVAGGEAVLLLVEHPPVITFGRRDGQQCNLLASQETLAEMNVDLVQSDRGGDVTFHGPGQIVAYPIVRLNNYHLSVGGYVRRLEDIVISTLKQLKIPAFKDDSAIGVWVNLPGPEYSSGPVNISAKICALGVRIRKGVSLHGIALNVTTDLRYFNLIVPCGLAARPVTSIQNILQSAQLPLPMDNHDYGDSIRALESASLLKSVRKILINEFQAAFPSATTLLQDSQP